MGADMFISGFPLNLDSDAAEHVVANDLNTISVTHQVLRDRAGRFVASDRFGEDPDEYPVAWVLGLDDDLPAETGDTDRAFRDRLIEAVDNVLGVWPRDVTLWWDHLTDRRWVFTGGLSWGDEPTEATADVDIIAATGIADDPITVADITAGT